MIVPWKDTYVKFMSLILKTQFKNRTFHVQTLIPSVKTDTDLVRTRVEWPTSMGATFWRFKRTSHFSCAEPNALITIIFITG